jgi:superoxide dismutase, Fe-Mn family
MKHLLPKLEYSYEALEPYIDAKTMEIHHSKHHQAYIDKLNGALEKYPDLFKSDIDDLLSQIDKVPEEIRTIVKNHGGGHSNHSLFWQIMTPNATERKFEGVVAEEIIKQFGDYDKFKKLFSDVALGRFGSGWAWLVMTKDKLEIINTPNQDSPLMEGKLPLFGIDVWEHAYYLKYQNRRAEYIDAFFNVINWKHVNELFEEYSGS